MAHHKQQTNAGEYRTILLIGPPGSGKGTQGRILGQVPGYWFVSMGEILRSLDAEVEPGRQIQQHLHSGELVPAELAISVWTQYMADQLKHGFRPGGHILVLDGLPRNVEQAALLQSHVRVECVVHLACDDESNLLERIRHRDAERQDDAQDDVVRHRFDVYREQTAPLLDWYPSDVIVAVDAARVPLEVLGQIVSALTRPQHESPVAS